MPGTRGGESYYFWVHPSILIREQRNAWFVAWELGRWRQRSEGAGKGFGALAVWRGGLGGLRKELGVVGGEDDDVMKGREGCDGSVYSLDMGIFIGGVKGSEMCALRLQARYCENQGSSSLPL